MRTRRDVRCEGTWEIAKCKGLLGSITDASSEQKKKDQNKHLKWELGGATGQILATGARVLLGTCSKVPGVDSAPGPLLGT